MPANIHDRPGWWLGYFANLIAKFGPENDHPSYRNPGRARELVEQWASLDSGKPSSEQVQALAAAIFAELQQQDTPIHSMWNEFYRGFVAWAKAIGCDPGESP